MDAGSSELLREAVRAATGQVPTALHAVGGGDFAASFAATLPGGRRVFVKTHPSPPPCFFTTEANGLRWLREAATIGVPEVLGVSDGGGGAEIAHLVMEWIEPGSPNGTTEERFGRALAALHGAGAPCFGREDRRTTGSLALPNEPCDSWSVFYAERRLLPLVKLAADRQALEPSLLVRIERLAGGLDRFDDGQPPARLHGDLWAGNRLVDRHGNSWLIDPAAHGGHREFDLAMMALFGGFGAACWRAYEDLTPLGDGWPDRRSLHQLAPLIVHAIKFGGSYATAVARAVDTYV